LRRGATRGLKVQALPGMNPIQDMFDTVCESIDAKKVEINNGIEVRHDEFRFDMEKLFLM